MFSSPLLKSSAKPADWKYQNGLSASWLSLECTVYVNIHIPLSTTSVNYTLEKNLCFNVISLPEEVRKDGKQQKLRPGSHEYFQEDWEDIRR